MILTKKGKSVFEGLTGKPLLEAIKKNHAALKACPCHEFPINSTNWRLNDRVKCKKCGGEMTIHDARLWTDGYVAGLQRGQEIAR